MMWIREKTRVVVVLALVVSACGVSGEVLRYNRDVRPILAEHCFNCHGADEKARKAKLRLDDEASARAERDGVIAIVPGDVDAR